MFIEINGLTKAKKYLTSKYNLCKKNELSNIKYNHLIDCLNILKFYKITDYINYGQAVILHDIGRLYENESKATEFDHAEYGYKLLKKEFTNRPIVLLPVKYHEEDLTWHNLIQNDLEFLNCSKKQKKKIIYGCKLVRDIDIISNMKYIVKQDLKCKKVKSINEKIIENLCNGEISTKEDIHNAYDEISYILCGLNLLSYKKSFKYLKKYKIVEMLINKQLKMVLDNVKLYNSTTEMYKFIKTKFNL